MSTPELGWPIEATFEVERPTKNTVRYKEVAEGNLPPKVGTVYIQKWAMAGKTPQKIRVVIQIEGE